MLGEAKVDELGNVYDTKDCNAMYLDKEGEDREINVNTSSFFFFFFFLGGVMSNLWLQCRLLAKYIYVIVKFLYFRH